MDYLSKDQNILHATGFRYCLRLNKASIFYILTASLLVNTLSLAVPLTIMQVYDRVIPYGAIESFVWLTIGCITGIWLEVACRWAKDKFANSLGNKYEARLQNTVFYCRIHSSTLNQKDSVGYFMDAYSSIAKLRNFYCNQVLTTLADLPLALLMMALIYYLNPTAGKTLVILAALSLTLILFFQGYYRRIKARHRDTQNTVAMFLNQVLSKIHFVKSGAIEDRILRIYEKLRGQLSLGFFKSTCYEETAEQVASLATVSSMFIVILAGSNAVIENQTTIGVLTACMILAPRAMGPLFATAVLIFRLPEIIHSRRILSHFLRLRQASHKQNLATTDHAPTSLLSIKDVYLQDDEKSEEIGPINLELSKATFVSIIKSSKLQITPLLYAISGLGRIDKGQISIAGKPASQSLLGSELSFASWLMQLHKGSVIDNLTSFDNRRNQHVMRIAEELKIDVRIAELASGYATKVDREANFKISRTVLSLMFFLRAVASDAKVIVLDEIDGSLDYDGMSIFLQAVERLSQDKVFVVATSNTETMLASKQIYQLKSSGLVERNKSDISSLGQDWIG